MRYHHGIFFFSSRRQHTRFDCDWSSDVCSSDLIADLGRLGMLAETVRERGVTVACIDHHISKGDLPPGPRYVDADAAATGELVREIARANDWDLNADAARALYVAIVTDTGGFRFSNTKARTLRAAADLLEQGIDPEAIYVELYSKAPEGRV